MQLIEPCEKYLQSYYEACKENWNNVHNNYIVHNPDEFEDWKKHIFNDYENQKNGINLPDEYAPSVTYWVVDGDKYIGTINIRLKLTEQLKKYGGHFGIVVRASERNKKYGTEILRLGMEKAHELGISSILLTCQEANEYSFRILKKTNYYKMEKDVAVENGISQNICRFYYR